MKEYKFRAWIKPIIEDGEVIYTGCMVDVQKIDFVTKRIAYLERNPYLPMYGSYEWVKFENIELLEYTGIKDDGDRETEIYDGDIVMGSWDEQVDEYHTETMCVIGEVYWSDTYGSWMIIERPSTENNLLYDCYGVSY